MRLSRHAATSAPGPEPASDTHGETHGGISLERLLAAIALHEAVVLPGVTLCRNCGWPHPCPTHRVASRLIAKPADDR